MKTVELFPPNAHNQETARLGHPSERIHPRGGDCGPPPGGSIATDFVSAAPTSPAVQRQSDLRPPLRAPTPVSYPPQGLPGGAEPPDRRRLRSNMTVVGVASLLVFGSYALAEGQTSFRCDPQYSYCYPGYGFYPGGGHGGWGGFGGYGVQYGGFGAAGVNDGYSGG